MPHGFAEQQARAAAALGVTAARSKREDPDAPGQVPMRPERAIRTAPSEDQKKARRQM